MMKHIILIHGAWASGWAWQDLSPYLSKADYQLHPISLIGSLEDDPEEFDVSLADYCQQVVKKIAELTGDIYLVAHSGGGLTATGVAEAIPERIKSIAYVAGMMLPSGLRFDQLCQQLSAQGHDVSGIGPYLQESTGGTRVPVEAALKIFLHDIDPDCALQVSQRLVRQPNSARYSSNVWTEQGAGRIPRLYVEALQDRSVRPIAQKAMQALVPATEVASLDCGHFPQLAMPQELAAILISFFTRYP
ncbi:alpha/beta fold hydrolase [Marinomonas sp.]